MRARQFARIAWPFLLGAVAIPVAVLVVAMIFGRTIEVVVGQARASYAESVALIALALMILSTVSLGLYAVCLRLGPANPRSRTSLLTGCISTLVAVAIYLLTLNELFLVLLHFGVAAAAGLFVKKQAVE